MKKTGLIHIYTGDGKGKTTASIGLAVRAAGSGLNVLFVQFFKEDNAESGEKAFFRNIAGNIELIRSNCRHPFFTGAKTDEDAVGKAIKNTFDLVREKTASGNVGLLVLDEIMAAINGNWLDMAEVIGFLDSRPHTLEVVLTGRNAPPAIVKMADYVTEMLKIKHPFDAGGVARKGIEY
ncbi:MAG: cob(I)yrinic acid a,c-diamide adenosyltransferase [Deltaproteobacteria bacterium]|nr:cob(I)yrinic acid a,c-diamide adenosyltransferase [Deltaproteobacteria bacterium]